MTPQPVSLTVLIVEDEFIIADEIAMIVEHAGHSVVGPVATVDEAINLISANELPRFAIMDANLNGQSSAPLARKLDELGVPFCVCTGYRSDDLRSAFGNAPILQKPINTNALIAMINAGTQS